jgi:hypothetical protein
LFLHPFLQVATAESRCVVLAQLGGFPEDFGYALEDWELFSKVVLGGYNLQTIPDPLYWYERCTNSERVLSHHCTSCATELVV